MADESDIVPDSLLPSNLRAAPPASDNSLERVIPQDKDDEDIVPDNLLPSNLRGDQGNKSVLSQAEDKREHYAGVISRGVLEGAGAGLGTGAGMIKGLEDLGPYLAHHATNFIRSKMGYDELPNTLGLQSPLAAVQTGQQAGTSLGTGAANALQMGTPDESKADQTLSTVGHTVGASAIAPGNPGANIIGGLAGEGARQVAKSAGAGPMGQFAAGLAGSVVPTAGSAAVRGLVRGVDPAEMNQNLQQGKDIGVPQTLGQAAGNPWLERLEGYLSRVWGGNPISKVGEAQSKAVEGQVAGTTNKLANGAPITQQSVGSTVDEGVSSHISDLQKTEGDSYDAVRAALPAGENRISASRTAAVLNDVSKPIKGAENFSSAFTTDRMKGAAEGFAKDAQEVHTPSSLAGEEKPIDVTLPYDAMRAIRTRIGQSITSDTTNVPEDQIALRRLYGALSEDMKQGIVNMGNPKLTKLANDADAAYRVNASAKELLGDITSKAGGPEAVYQAATNATNKGSTKIGAVMSALDKNPAAQDQLRASLLSRLGKKAPDADFDPKLYLKNWKAMAPEAKDAVFGQNAPLRKSLDSLSDAMDRLSEGPLMNKKGGLVGTMAHTGGLMAILGAVGEHVMQGHPGALVGVGSVVGGSYALSKAFTNPNIINWMAHTTTLPPGAMNQAITQLGNMKDPEAKEFAQYLQAKIGNQ